MFVGFQCGAQRDSKRYSFPNFKKMKNLNIVITLLEIKIQVKATSNEKYNVVHLKKSEYAIKTILKRKYIRT